MTLHQLTALPVVLLTGALLVGCQPHTPPPATQPAVVMATPEKIAAYRESIQKLKPGSIVGLVDASNADGRYASVTDVNVQDFKIGQTISFVDSDGNPINIGQIKNIANDRLVVQYDVQGKRAPEKGDLALWLKE